MTDIQTTEKSYPQTLREAHETAVGDVWLRVFSGGEEVLRIASEETGGGGSRRFTMESWSFAEGRWVPQEPRRTLTERDLRDHYRLCLTPIGELLAGADALSQGHSPFPESGGDARDGDVEALVRTGGAESLSLMLRGAQMLEDRLADMKTVMRARIAEQTALLEKRMAPLREMIKDANRRVEVIRQAISVVEIYRGQNLMLVTVADGTPADAGTPVTVRQRILFMDEECASVDEDGRGMDWWTRERFYEWLKTPRNRDIVLPEAKCVVAAKPRRFDARYCSGWSDNRALNEWNRLSFLLIRNGERVFVAESDDLCIHDAAVPRRSDFESIRKEMDGAWHESAEKRYDSLRYRSTHLAMVLQGLADRTDIFSPSEPSPDFMKGTGVEVVFDAEDDALLGTGRLPFPEWLREQGAKIRRGSRVIYIRGLSRGRCLRHDPLGYGLQFDERGYCGPSQPETGVYTVEDYGERGLGFTYLPGDSVRGGDGYGPRKRRETWLFEKDRVLDYDATDPEELRAYVLDRTQRRHYESALPVLRRFEKELSEERAHERLFKDALGRTVENLTEVEADEALAWWKTRVIHVRPVSSDDDKAWRMIRAHILKARKEAASAS